MRLIPADRDRISKEAAMSHLQIIARCLFMAGMTEAGEEKAWELVLSRDPSEVAGRAGVSYDSDPKCFLVRSYGMDFSVSTVSRTIESPSPGSDLLLGRLAEFFRLSLLWYLASAKDLPCTGRLTGIGQIKGGEAFSRGSHLLPLGTLAEKYGHDREGFLNKGIFLGGEVRQYGDASIELRAFPRVPVVITLWLADDEFPARADLLLDSSCDLQLPPDITWSIALMSVLAML